jgi:WD40 repeat protein
MFTLGKGHTQLRAWQDELYALIEDQYPDSFREKMEKERKVFSYANRPADVRLVICMREDYLPHLSVLKSRIHSIDRVIFRLTGLDRTQAREVIGMRGKGIRDEALVENILRSSSTGEPGTQPAAAGEDLEVEPILLSLLCYRLWEKADTVLLTKEDRDRVIGEFYDSQTRDIPDRVQKYIEKNLVNESGDRVPLRLDDRNRYRRYLQKLMARRILGPVSYYDRECIEIIHDVLAAVIHVRRRKRRFKTWKFIIAGLSLALMIFIFLVISINDQYHKAYINNLIFEAREMLPVNSMKALRIAEFAYRETAPPPPRLLRTLSDIVATTLTEPLYTTISKHKGNILSTVFSPDGTRILTASDDNTAKLWDLRGNLLMDLHKHTKAVNSALFSPNGTLILTASDDNTAKLWDCQGNLLTDFNKHTGAVNSASFSPNGTFILTASDDNTTKLWDLRGNLLADLNKHTKAVNSALFSPNGTLILTASDDTTAKLWNLEGTLLADLNKHTKAVNSAIFSPNGIRILTASDDTTAKLWDLRGNLLADLNKHTKAVNSALFSSDGTLILTASGDSTAKLWDPQGYLSANLNRYIEGVISTVFSPDDTHSLTTSLDSITKLWVSHGYLLADFNKHMEGVTSAVFSPDGTHILTASLDNTAKLWDLRGNLLTDFNKQTDFVLSAVFSPGGTRILTASKDGTAKLWYTPEAIIQWLKTAPIPRLTEEEIKRLKNSDE